MLFNFSIVNVLVRIAHKWGWGGSSTYTFNDRPLAGSYYLHIGHQEIPSSPHTAILRHLSFILFSFTRQNFYDFFFIKVIDQGMSKNEIFIEWV